MSNKEIHNAKDKELYNAKDKNSQEILLYLQTKNFKKGKSFYEAHNSKLENGKIHIVESNENLPPTRMKQFINNNLIFLSKNKSNILSKNISEETKELTTKGITPKFNQTQSSIKINLSKKENNSQFSFSNKENINDNSFNYLDFHLHEKLYKNDEISHLYLPIKYKNDEEYKANLYKYLKAENRKNKIMHGNKTQVLEKNKINNFGKMCKNRKILPASVRKKDNKKIRFFRNNSTEIEFNLYRDDVIGVEHEWQLPIAYHNYDNDIESDEEQINKGKDKMMYDLRLGIIKWSQNKKLCYNYKYVNGIIDNENEIIKNYSKSCFL